MKYKLTVISLKENPNFRRELSASDCSEEKELEVTHYCDVKRVRAKKTPLGESTCWFVVGLGFLAISVIAREIAWGLVYIILALAAMAGRLTP